MREMVLSSGAAHALPCVLWSDSCSELMNFNTRTRRKQFLWLKLLGMQA